MKKLRITIWNEFRHEKKKEEVRALYPNGIHAFIADFLKCDEFDIKLAALDDPDCGLPDEVLNNTDVLIWWGHMYHWEVPDDLVDRIRDRVYRYGMGFVALHSAHESKPFMRIVGTTGSLFWGDKQKEIIWNVNPSHPIAAGIPERIDIECEEMYGEPFMIPKPDDVVFASWFEKGNIFRSGCCFNRGLGKIFYFQPGHETLTSYYIPAVQQIIRNAVRWAAPCEKPVRYPAVVFNYKND